MTRIHFLREWLRFFFFERRPPSSRIQTPFKEGVSLVKGERKTKNKKTILGIKRRQNLFKIVALGIHVMMKRESNFYKYLNMSKIKYKLDDVVDVKLNKA